MERVTRYPTVEKLLAGEDPATIGGPGATRDDVAGVLASIYPQPVPGYLAIEISPIAPINEQVTGATRSRETYGLDWNFRHHRPIDALTEEEARSRYQSGEHVVIAVGAPLRPEVVIEVHWNNQYLGVWFFDNLGRQATKFQFTRYGNDRLFLNSVTAWKYPGDTARGLHMSILVDEFTFETDGRAVRIIKDDIAQETVTQQRTGVDVSTNWEPVPTFGDWASIARFERAGPSRVADSERRTRATRTRSGRPWAHPAS